MKKLVFILGFTFTLCLQGTILAHCQMPCGIYHDNMVYDQIDQYIETMYKGVTVLNDNKFNNPHDRNEFVRWVMLKENSSNDTAELIMTYFLQQKMKPGEDGNAQRLESAHKLLFLLVQIKQNDDRNMVNEFADEWDKFKLMFHVEGYECQVDLIKQRRLELQQQKAQQGATGSKPVQVPHNHNHDHDHDHDDDHDHTH
jgi:nickel superoxide dismutase